MLGGDGGMFVFVSSHRVRRFCAGVEGCVDDWWCDRGKGGDCIVDVRFGKVEEILLCGCACFLTWCSRSSKPLEYVDCPGGWGRLRSLSMCGGCGEDQGTVVEGASSAIETSLCSE